MDTKDNSIDMDNHDGCFPAGSLTEVMVPRVYGDTPSMMEVPIAYEPDDLAGADAVFLGKQLLTRKVNTHKLTHKK